MGVKDRMKQAADQAKQKASQAVESAKPQGGAESVKSSMKDAGGLGKQAFTSLVDRIDPAVLASVIIKITSAQEKANLALAEKESPYRIGEVSITATFPPQISFVIIRGEAP